MSDAGQLAARVATQRRNHRDERCGCVDDYRAFACVVADETEALMTERDRLAEGLRAIASRRCLSEGPCSNHSHPQCRGGSCVTCQARAHVAHLDGDDPLDVFEGKP